MGTVSYHPTVKSGLANQQSHHHDKSNDGGNGGGDDMLDRVKKLEEQVLALVTDIAIIKSNYVTKADLHEEISKQTKWIAATVIGTTGLALTVAKLIF